MYRKATNGWLKHWDFLLLDILCLQLSYFATKTILRDTLYNFYVHMYRDEAFILLICELVVVFFTQPFKNILRRKAGRELLKCIQHVATVMIVNIVYLYLTHQAYFFSRLLFVLTGILFFGLLFSGRMILKSIILHRLHSKSQDASLVVVTTRDRVEGVIQGIRHKTFRAYAISAIFVMDTENPERERIHGIPIYGKNEDIVERICHEWVDEVYINLPEGCYLSRKVIDTLLTMGVTTHFSLSMLERGDGDEHYLEKFGGNYVITSSLKMVSANQVIYKRLGDIIVALIGCAVTGILYLFLAPRIKKESPGPAFFKQTRVGLNGRTFQMYKFRSMYMDAEKRKKEYLEQNKADSSLMFKMDDDPRIIGSGKKNKKGKPAGIGNFIRRTSLDEFPQFINVLKGDMSLVGTRPPTLDEWEQYGTKHRARMSIKPGITGLWQVSGRSKITDFDQVVELDKDYIRNWSIGLDIRILFRTLRVVLKQEGAE